MLEIEEDDLHEDGDEAALQDEERARAEPVGKRREEGGVENRRSPNLPGPGAVLDLLPLRKPHRQAPDAQTDKEADDQPNAGRD